MKFFNFSAKTIKKLFIVCLLVLIAFSFLYELVRPIEKRLQTKKIANEQIKIHYIKKRKDIESTLIKYNKSDYELAYKAFLANGNVNDAYVVAKAAVEQNPENIVWRKRLAEVARWSEQYRDALEQSMFFARTLKTKDALEQAIKVAKMTFQYNYLLELYQLQIENNIDIENSWKGLVESAELMGKPEYAINLLKNTVKTEKKVYLYELLAGLYKSSGNVNAEIKIHEKIEKTFGPNVANAAKHAEALYSQGSMEKAYEKLLEVFPKATNQDIEYWKNFGQLAWLMKDRKSAAHAFNIMYESNQITIDSLINYIEYTQDIQPLKALQLATSGWNKTKEPFFIYKILDLGQRLGKWNLLAQEISSLDNATLSRLNEEAFFVSIRSQIFMHFGEVAKAKIVYEKALKQMPDSVDLQVNYLWFLINNGFKTELQQAIVKFTQNEKPTPRLIHPVAVAFIVLNQYQRVIEIYRNFLEHPSDDDVWLLDAADDLEGAGFSNAAIHIRQYVWHRLIKSYSENNQPFAGEEKVAFSRLLRHQSPGDHSANNIAFLSNQDKDQLTYELMMIWALDEENYMLANKLWKTHQERYQTPEWMQQSLALYNDDRYKLQELLEKNIQLLPYRDRVIAAERVGNIKLAQHLAYQGLSEHPEDHEMLNIFKDTMLPTSSYVDISQEYQIEGNIVGPRTLLTLKYLITPHFSISPYVNFWKLHSKDQAALIIPQKYDLASGLTFEKVGKRIDVSATVGFRKSLSSLINSAITATYRINKKLNATVSFGYNQGADESDPLAIAGKKHYLQEILSYQVTQRDTATAQASQKLFYTQDNGIYLGKGFELSMLFEHKFTLSYPDWHIDFSANMKKYSPSNNAITGKAAQVVPAGETLNSDFFIPISSNEMGINFGFGEIFQEEYTHDFKPFANAGLSYNTKSQIGTLITGGIAGSVFGRDHMALYFSRNFNSTTPDQINYLFGISYRAYLD